MSTSAQPGEIRHRVFRLTIAAILGIPGLYIGLQAVFFIYAAVTMPLAKNFIATNAELTLMYTQATYYAVMGFGAGVVSALLCVTAFRLTA